jgi:hypothetical protein
MEQNTLVRHEGRRVFQYWNGILRDVGSEEGFFSWWNDSQAFEELNFFLVDVTITAVEV